jgi:hypothetical protein
MNSTQSPRLAAFRNFAATRAHIRRCVLPAVLALGRLHCLAQAGAAPASAEQIVAVMAARNESRAAALAGYTGRRIYRLSYRGFPANKDAELVVEARFRAPATKEFTVISQSGSKFVIEKILKRLLSSEQEAASRENRQDTALTPRNYSFELAGREGACYVLKVQPRVANKFLYRGRIWVDATDFALVRIEGEPARNPSIWISNTRIEQNYGKFGRFWLPVQNRSTSKVRLGGTATLVIDYQDYRLVPAALAASAR